MLACGYDETAKALVDRWVETDPGSSAHHATMRCDAEWFLYQLEKPLRLVSVRDLDRIFPVEQKHKLKDIARNVEGFLRFCRAERVL